MMYVLAGKRMIGGTFYYVRKAKYLSLRVAGNHRNMFWCANLEVIHPSIHGQNQLTSGIFVKVGN